MWTEPVNVVKTRRDARGPGARWQRYWALVRRSIWYWRQRCYAAVLDPRQHQGKCAADGAHEVPQEDAGVGTERRMLAALFEAGKRELP